MSYLLMDVGGTQIKAQTAGGNPFRFGRLQYFDSKSTEDKKTIGNNFAAIIRTLVEQLPEEDRTLQGLGMAFPGPFDYEQGISLMKNLKKYDAIYGYRIREELRKLLPDLLPAEIPIRFLHDVEAFAIGEYAFGAAAGSHRAFFVCIGTGAGSAFMKEGVVLKKESDGVPSNGWIYSEPFSDGTIDDYVSARGLASAAAHFFDKIPSGKELDELCTQNDSRALSAYTEFGENLFKALHPFLFSFQPDTLVLGGQISRGFRFFGKRLQNFCFQSNIRIALCENTSESALKGLYSAMLEDN